MHATPAPAVFILASHHATDMGNVSSAGTVLGVYGTHADAFAEIESIANVRRSNGLSGPRGEIVHTHDENGRPIIVMDGALYYSIERHQIG
jgi:hypothetical protein